MRPETPEFLRDGKPAIHSGRESPANIWHEAVAVRQNPGDLAITIGHLTGPIQMST